MGHPCKVGEALATMDSEDLTDLTAMLEGGVGSRRIAAALAAIGHPISATVINEHRAHVCRCYRVVASRG